MLLKFLAKKTVYGTIPIYNLNWIRSSRFYRALLGDLRITVVDIGARNSSLEELQPLSQFINYIGFDADEKEVERLNKTRHNFNSAKYIPKFVAGHTGFVDFMLHYDAGCSSVYRFDDKFSAYYQDLNEDRIEKTIRLSSDTLDNLVPDAADVDVLKMDTQGNEFEILSGAPNTLDKALMVEIEVEFFQLYEGQKLAHDIFSKMHGHGFDLLYLNRVLMSSRRFKGVSRGQIIFGDALFGLSRESVKKLTTEKKIKYCCLLINYGHYDFAYDLYLDNEDIEKSSPALSQFFVKANKKPSSFIKLIKYMIDKIIFVLLYLRKTNGLKSDSDRSWPIR